MPINKVFLAFNSNLLCAFSSAVAGAIIVSTTSTTVFTRVSTHDDVSRHDDVNSQDNIDQDEVTTAITDIPVSAAETIVTTALTISVESTKTNVEVTQAPKRKGVMIQDPKETTKIASLQQPQKQEANDALINTWDDIQAKIDAYAQLAQRLHEDEQLQFTDTEKAKLFMEFIEKRRIFFAAKRDEEKRNRPPTKAQQRSIMSTYLKNMDGWKIKSLKNKSFAEIQELFDKAMKRINTFVDFRTELVEESTKKDEAETVQESRSKREGDELEQERSKK
nr:hypothetical protein [Tanacetum cinerariifolium]